MTETERFAWVQLAFTPYIGAESFTQLIEHCGSAEAALKAPAALVAQLGRYGKQAAAAWHDTDKAKTACEAAFNWEKQPDCRLLLSCDDDFPMRLKEGLTPPPVLFVRGNVDLLRQASVGIVGSRHATPQAMRIAGDFGCALSEQNITVISGMAAGIDTAAHHGALQGTGSTIAVWGTGIDRIYPQSNQKLAYQIAEQGAIVSEFPLGTRPLAGNFPRRNRLIAGLAQAVLVVEAALESGSLITARLAGEMGREVMAIPGSIDNPHSKGCHKLIKEGAKLVECLDDILSECPELLQKSIESSGSTQLPTKLSTRKRANVSRENKQPALVKMPQQKVVAEEGNSLLAMMGYDPIHPDLLAEKCKLATDEIYAQLTELELDGVVAAMPGGRFQRIK